LAIVIRAYEEQLEAVEAAGSPIILMASRALVRVARSADDYVEVYDRLLRQAREPLIIHWLGDMFDPQLAGLLGSERRADCDGDRARSHPRSSRKSRQASRSRCWTPVGRSRCGDSSRLAS
jgi:hypothetical protein